MTAVCIAIGSSIMMGNELGANNIDTAVSGVGQKTAGVVLLAAFGDDQIPVDTHVFRVSHRIGLADATTPDGVEKQLQAILPREEWSHAHHLLIWHGRRVCHARGPECDRCPLKAELCENGA